MTTLILIIAPTMFGILFFYLGMYQERIGWNKLIEKGTLPKPIQEGKTKSNTKPFTEKGRQAPPPFHSETRTMTQTAVEWQFEQLFNSFEKFNNGECTFNDYLKRNLEIRKQAKNVTRVHSIYVVDSKNKLKGRLADNIGLTWQTGFGQFEITEQNIPWIMAALGIWYRNFNSNLAIMS